MPNPTIRQVDCGSMQRNFVDDLYHINLFNETAAANNGILIIEGDSSCVITGITDDKSNTWEQFMTPLSAGQTGHVWRCANLAAGTRKINIQLDTDHQFMQFTFIECAYLSSANAAGAVDGTPQTNTAISGSTISTSNITTSQNNSILFQFAFDENVNLTTGYTKGTGWTKLCINDVDGIYIQYQVKATAGAVTPTLTKSGPATTYDTLAFAIKADSSKGDHTLPAGPRTRLLQHLNFQTGGTSITLELPCLGTLLTCRLFQGDPAVFISSVTDTNGNNWQEAVRKASIPSGNGAGSIWYAANATPSLDLKVTVNIVTTPGNFGMILLDDIVGADPSPLGATAVSNGTQSSAGNLDTSTITPTAQNSLMLSCGAINIGCANGVTGGSRFFADMMYFDASTGNDDTLDEADLWSRYHNDSNLSAALITYTVQGAPSGVGTWAHMVAEFKAASSPASSLSAHAPIANRFMGWTA